jgi:RNA polymerase-binding protein DksA
MAERAVGNKGGTTTKSAQKTATKTATAKKAVAAKSKPGSAAKKSTATGDATPAKAAKSTAAAQKTPKSAAPPRAAESAVAKGATMAKAAESKTAAASKEKPAARKGSRSAAETEKIRLALTARRDELQVEYSSTVAELAELQRDRLTDSAGDDQADTGTKTFEREQEITLANAILERITQVERALERLDEGSYGWCERCGNPIPVERLAAFPSATLCVSCKQLEERR